MDEQQNIQAFIKRLNLLNDDDQIKVYSRTRSNGEGSIRKKGKGYEGRLTIGLTPEGKQIRKSVYAKTRKECNDKLQIAIRAVKERNLILNTNLCPTLKDWLNLWLKEYRMDLSVTTLKRYYSFIAKINPTTLNKTLTELLPLELQQYINTFVSYELANRAISMLECALSDAINNGFIQRNPAAGLRNPLSPTLAKFDDSKKTLTKHEEDAFVQAIENNPYKLIYLACLYAGLRRGEACALTWDKIDLDKRLIQVSEAAKRGENKGYSSGKTKTASSIRSVPISQKLYDALVLTKNKKGLLCPNSSGKLLNADIISMDFQSVMKKLNQRHTLHHLRHTFATNCITIKDIQPKVVQSWMGHATVDMTMNTYTHANQDLIEQEVKKLD